MRTATGSSRRHPPVKARPTRAIVDDRQSYVKSRSDYRSSQNSQASANKRSTPLPSIRHNGMISETDEAYEQSCSGMENDSRMAIKEYLNLHTNKKERHADTRLNVLKTADDLLASPMMGLLDNAVRTTSNFHSGCLPSTDSGYPFRFTRDSNPHFKSEGQQYIDRADDISHRFHDTLINVRPPVLTASSTKMSDVSPSESMLSENPNLERVLKNDQRSNLSSCLSYGFTKSALKRKIH